MNKPEKHNCERKEKPETMTASAYHRWLHSLAESLRNLHTLR
ncbi:hypothetical protein [Parahaliea maris]|nr:hypothetical protein [Parahaliea maris]